MSRLIDGLVAGVSVRSTDDHMARPVVLKTSAVDDGRFDPGEAKPILVADVRRARCKPVRDSIIISRMNTPALVGEVGYVEEDCDDIYLPDRLWLARARRGAEVDMRWLAYYLSSERGGRAVRELATGTSGSMKNIPKARFLALEVEIPPLQEQQLISGALRDVDALIASLERLIAKRQAIKQGMMQELLTGRTRLPGFSQQWQDTTAGAIGFFKGGSGFPVRFQGRQDGKYPFFKVSDMNNPGNELFMNEASNYIDEKEREKIGAVCMPENAIVFAKVGAAVFLERKRILTRPSCIDNNMAAFVIDSAKADVRFVHCLLSMFRMSSLVATTALPSLNNGQLRPIPLRLPTELNEQRAIAAVLDDVDQELGVLDSCLAKARNIKQGMMQELLTGRTRLPVETVS